jgi:murein DD-endopeptidase MepM/ murein hydrolase activator NlpD
MKAFSSIINNVCFVLLVFAAIPSLAQKPNSQPCIPKQEMDRIQAKIRAGKNSPERVRLRAAVQEERTEAIGSHAFIWPMVAAPHFYQPGIHAIGKYVDLNPVSSGGNANTLQDYNCGTRTYDLETGYDHTGIDIGTAPFGWNNMVNDNVYVRAAEGGIIVDRSDGNSSWNCAFGMGNSNTIAIEHSDGSVAFYFHMKEGSVTSKYEGQIVRTGEYLGVVGSSGNSTGPHLHFEVQDENGIVIDPFQNGPCNRPSGVGSLWADEEPYINKKILSVFTTEFPWIDGNCSNGIGSQETVSYKNHFSSAGDFAYISAAVRDAVFNDPLRLRVYTPSGALVYDNTFLLSVNFDAKWVLPSQLVALPASTGTYRLVCTYAGQSEVHLFTVGCPGAQTLTGSRASNTGVISGSTINSTETIANGVRDTEYQAETAIQFNPGFTAASGSEFLGRIDACTTGQQRVQRNKSPLLDKANDK